MAVCLGIDVGTSGTKALAISPEGTILASASANYGCAHPKPLWSEQDPEDWWTATVKVVRAVIKQAKLKPADVAAIGLSGQMHGSVFLDKAGKVIRPAILWNDQRTAKECEEIESRAGGRAKLIQMVANPALAGFTAPKILWLRNNEPKNFAKTVKVLLPKCYESEEVTGTLTANVAKQLGLTTACKVVGGAGDCAAGAVGNGIVKTGLLATSIGTSGVVFVHSDEPQCDPAGRLHTFCHAVRGKWHMMGVILSAGGSLQWFQDALCSTICKNGSRKPTVSFEELVKEAAATPTGAEGLQFLPYLAGERTPHLDPHARGALIGLTLAHGRGHIVRSILEGVTYALRDSFEIIEGLGVPVKQVRAGGGGAKNPFWRQMQADVFGKAVSAMAADEGPAYGVALLAAVGAGHYKDISEACAAAVKTAESSKPDAKTKKVYDQTFPVFQGLYRALQGEFPKLG